MMRPLLYVEDTIAMLERGACGPGQLIEHAREMVAEIKAQRAKDRPLLLQMAATIAGGIIANPNVCNWDVPPGADITDKVAEASLGVAQHIIARLDAQKS